MKFRLIYLLFAGTLCFLVLPGNKNGRASESQKGNTGAPGDETNLNGTPRTCSYCHFGAAGPVTYIHLIDENGDTVTQYLPGQKYKAQVFIDNKNTNLTGYGFQMIALRNSDSADVKGFSDPGNNTVNNYKLATIPNGRTYAEHDNISTSKQFDVVWTAPAAGTGAVTFYAAGNAVNRNGTTSGDGTDNDVLQINEAPPASTTRPGVTAIQVQLWPNPLAGAGPVYVQVGQSGAYQLRVTDPAGRLFWETNRRLEAGPNTLDLPAAAWNPGVFFLEISNGERWGVVRFLKV